MRIAFCTLKLRGLTGKVRMLEEIVPLLHARGWSVDLLAQSVDWSRFREVGARVRRLPRPPLSLYGRMRVFSACARLLTAGRYDVVCGHGQTFAQDVLYVHNCFHLEHERVHGEPLDERRSPNGRIQREILERGRFRRVVANSRLTREDLVRRYGLAPERIEIVYPGAHPVFFGAPAAAASPATVPELRHELGIPPDQLVVGLVTSGNFRKRGVDLFLRALGALDASLRERLFALVVGNERDLASWEARRPEAGLGPRLRFLPSRPDVARVYRALDLFCLPARFEEFGRTALEAMASGVPVLTSDEVGASELLEGPARELVCRAGSLDSLASVLARALSDGALRARAATAGRSSARAHDLQANARAHVACYEALVASNDPT